MKERRRLVSMRLPGYTARRLQRMARHYGSQSNAVIELVDAAFGCPSCGNRDMDWLPWDEDENGDAETVTCGKCGTTYTPGEGVTA